MNNYKKQNNLKKYKCIIILLSLSLSITLSKNKYYSNMTKAINQNQPLELNIQKIKNEKMTTDDFILNLLRQNEPFEQIVNKYYNLPQEILSAIFHNNRIFKVKLNKKITNNPNELNNIQKVKSLIKEREAKYTSDLISLPHENNKNKPIVILNPGHGFEDSGATATTQDGKIIEEKNLNADITVKLLNILLKLNFEVYLIFDLKNYGIMLPKENNSLHIIFEGRPPIEGIGFSCRMADASAFGIKQIMKKIKENNQNARIISVCIHHNSSTNKNSSGFISFYRSDNFTSQNFEINSKRLAQMFLNHCNNIYNNNVSLKTEKWVVCGFGSPREKIEKQFDSEAAVLLELGFMNNPNELKKILNPASSDAMARALANAISSYFNSTQ